MKFTKRIATTALAGAMALSLAVPAFAANDTKITAKYADVKIDVVVPTTGTATINPYKLDVDVKKSNETTVAIKNQAIVTQPLAIVNKTKMKLNVDASVVATVTGSLVFATAAVEDAETGNKAYVFLETETESNNLAAANMEDGKLKQDDLIDAFAKWEANDTPEDGVDLVLKAGDAVKNTGDNHLCSLAAGKANTSDATQIDVQKGGVALFRLSGSVAKAPTVAWKSTDGFTATISFTFTPDTST